MYFIIGEYGSLDRAAKALDPKSGTRPISLGGRHPQAAEVWWHSLQLRAHLPFISLDTFKYLLYTRICLNTLDHRL